MAKVHIFTDGGADPNPGAGGWGAVLEYEGRIKELYGSIPHATNNQAELTAAIMGLRALKKPCEVVIYSDSQYLIFTMTKGWKRSKNADLWRELDEAAAPHEVDWQWVRGHVGMPGNERAHDLSVQGMREARKAS